MKKLFVLGLVLTVSTMATAGNVDFQIIAGGKPSYLPSDTITIALVVSNMGTTSDYWIGRVSIDAITTDNGGTASNLHWNWCFDLTNYDIVNSGGILIEDIMGCISFGCPSSGDGNIFWFDYHIPDLPHSTIITIDVSGMSFWDIYEDPLSLTYGGPLEIQMACCPGDTGNDGDIDILDYSKLRGRLKKAMKVAGAYYIAPDDPCAGIRALWNPCLDCNTWDGGGDGKVDLDDYSKLRGRLKKAYKLAGQYYISCYDPCEGVRALWPCECP